MGIFKIKLNGFLFFCGTKTAVGQGLPVQMGGLAFSVLLITHSRIVTATYGSMVHSGFELMTVMLLSRTR